MLATSITDVNGNAVFANVSAGSHTAKATKGTLSASKTFNVAGDTVVTLVLAQATNWQTIGIIAGVGALGAAILYGFSKKD